MYAGVEEKKKFCKIKIPREEYHAMQNALCVKFSLELILILNIMFVNPVFQISATVNNKPPIPIKFSSSVTVSEIASACNVELPFSIWTKPFKMPMQGLAKEFVHHGNAVYMVIESTHDKWQILCKSNRWYDITKDNLHMAINVCGSGHCGDWCDIAFFEGELKMQEWKTNVTPIYARTASTMPQEFVKNIIAATCDKPESSVVMYPQEDAVEFHDAPAPKHITFIIRHLSSVFTHTMDNSVLNWPVGQLHNFFVEKFAQCKHIDTNPLKISLRSSVGDLDNKHKRIRGSK